jgi:hypothetical protein
VTALVAAAVCVGTTGFTAAQAVTPANDPERATTTSLDEESSPRQDPTRATGPGLYIVTLVDKPSAVYTGGVPGHPATKPTDGERFDRTRPAVVSYESRLRAAQDQLLARVGNPTVVYRFTTAVNGFAAELNTKQVKQLRSTEGVALVEKSTNQKIDTVSSPEFLGLEGPTGTWAQVGGPAEAGKGTVVGVIDTGIWPENPSFAGLPLKAPGRSVKVRGFHGACQAGEQWDVRDCNDKVVSARYFVEGFGRNNIAQSDYLSPRDGVGHGSHTASVAAGNRDVAVQIQGQEFGDASGVAPAARVAVYKVCWAAPNPDDDGCATADAVAAINQAVADGVDVINYSISGTRETAADSVELAFLNAAASGVFVATSAGNSGPGARTVAHPSPWVTTVAASTHELLQGSIMLGDGTSHVGAMVSDQAVPSSRLVLSSDVAAPDATADEARLCEIGALDAEKVQDTIVVCDRGVTARVDKSLAVSRAGGVGMVLANAEPDSRDADFHSVPSVHVDVTAAATIKAYVEANGGEATASIDPNGSDSTVVPQVAEFSSRGPSEASGGNVLKPDLTAPGVSVVAAVSPPSNSGRLWDLYSGTSMSAPHVAGLAALVKAEKPGWSPAQVKSAMMTTAYDVEGSAGPFSQGAGHVDAQAMLDPGLVFDAGREEWLGFLAGQGFRNTDGSPVSDHPIDASNLNLPSIAVGDLTGRTRVTRTVTNVSGRTESFSARVAGLGGVIAKVRPAALTLAPGESAKFTVVLTTDQSTSHGTYAKGSLIWTGLTHQTRIPIVARPQLLTAPTEVPGTGPTGSARISGVSGTDRPIDMTATGLVGATPSPVSLVPGAFDPATPTQDDDTLATPVEVPAGTDVARFHLDGHNAGDDLDLYVYLDGELVASSATASADETVTLVEPPAGQYTVYVNSFSAANRSTTTGQLFSWLVGSGDLGNLALTPNPVPAEVGEPFGFEVSWRDLDMTQRWFGSIRYADSDRRTLVTVS